MAAYRAGDPVVTGHYPFAYSVCSEYINQYCSHCLKPLDDATESDTDSGFHCSGCDFARYCSARCEDEDSESHTYVCALVDVFTEDAIPTNLLLVTKVLVQLQNGYYDDPAVDGTAQTLNGHPRDFFELLSHKQKIYDDFSRITELKLWYSAAAELLEPLLNNVTDLLKETKSDLEFASPFDLFVEIIGKLQCNAFGIQDRFLNRVAEGLYLEASVFNHACGFERNAHYSFDGVRLNIKAFQDIETLHDVRISYVDCFVPPLVRQQKLQHRYYFTCQCRVCADPDTVAKLFAVQCQAAGCGGAVPLYHTTAINTSEGHILRPDTKENCDPPFDDLSVCPQCKQRPESAELTKCRSLTEDHLTAHTELALLSDESEESESGDLAKQKQYEEMIAEEESFHFTNFLRGLTFDCLGRSVSAHSENANELEVLHCLTESLEAHRNFFSENDPTLAMLLIDIGHLRNQQGLSDIAKDSFTEARAILEKAEFANSPLLALVNEKLHNP